MIHHLFTSEEEKRFVERVLKEPCFQSEGLALYANVPVKCIRYTGLHHPCVDNPCSAREKYTDRVIDYMVCDGNAPLLSICFDEQEVQSRNLFSTYLQDMDYVRCSFAEATPEGFEALYRKVAEQLQFYADYQLTEADYTLDIEAVEADADTLRKVCLTGEHVMTPFFARDCGLFFRCVLSGGDSVAVQCVTVREMAQTLRGVLHWHAPLSEDGALLQQILDAPLETFYGKRVIRLKALREYLKGIPGAAPATYRECLQLVNDLHRRIPDSGMAWDMVEGNRLNILLFLADVLSRDGLPVFSLSLRRYYHAAAEVTGTYYPIWLYERKVRPHLCNAQEDAFPVSAAAADGACEHAPVKGWHARLTALLMLMVWPVCSPNAQ